MATTGDWSELCPDVLQSVFERLSFTDFLQVRVVCSAWRFVSKRCLPKQDPFPWLIMLEHNKTSSSSSSCLLLCPEEERVCRIEDPNNNFADSDCLAVFGSWFLFVNPRMNLYALNLLTLEKIHLPPIESLKSQLYIQRMGKRMLVKHRDSSAYSLKICSSNMKAVFWVDEATKDYLVVWTLKRFCLAFCRKGDIGWREILTFESFFDRSGIRNIVYKNNKLFTYDYNNVVRIFDFSQNFPKEIGEPLIPRAHRFYGRLGPDIDREDCIAVTTSGDVLIIKKTTVTQDNKPWCFEVYKIDINAEKPEWKRMSSLDDEALLLDRQITVSTKDMRGIKENSIYFRHDSTNKLFRTNLVRHGDIGIFNLRTRRFERFEQCESLNGSTQDALWLFPGRGEK